MTDLSTMCGQLQASLRKSNAQRNDYANTLREVILYLERNNPNIDDALAVAKAAIARDSE